MCLWYTCRFLSHTGEAWLLLIWKAQTTHPASHFHGFAPLFTPAQCPVSFQVEHGNGARAQNGEEKKKGPCWVQPVWTVVSVENRTHSTNSPEEDLPPLVKAAILKNTKKATTFWVSVFNEFARKRTLLLICRRGSPQSSTKLFRHFNWRPRTKNGKFYKKSSYLAARASIGW